MPKIHPLAAAMVEDTPEFRQQLTEAVYEAVYENRIVLVPEWRSAVLVEADRQEFARVTPGPHEVGMVPNTASLKGGPVWLWPLNDEAWDHVLAMAEG